MPDDEDITNVENTLAGLGSPQKVADEPTLTSASDEPANRLRKVKQTLRMERKDPPPPGPGGLDKLRASLAGRIANIKPSLQSAPTTETALLDRIVETTMVLTGEQAHDRGLPFVDRATLRRLEVTQPPSNAALLRPVLPFGGVGGPHDDLEDTIRSDRPSIDPESDEPSTPPRPAPLAPMPAAAPPPEVRETIGQSLAARRPPPPPAMNDAMQPEPFLPLELYARIKVELWEERGGLATVLARHGVDEVTWREHELRQEALLREEAAKGTKERANAVRAALQKARDDRDAEAGPPSIKLADYARIRAAVEAADEPHRVLDKHELTSAEWARVSKAFRHRAMTEPGFAQKMREAVARAREPAAART